MAALEKHPKIRQHQPQIASEKKTASKTSNHTFSGAHLHGLNRKLGNRGLQRLLASNIPSNQVNATALPAVQRDQAATRVVASEDQLKALYEKGDKAYQLENYTTALNLFEQAYNLDPGESLFIYNIAQCHRRLNNYPQAIVYYKQFIAENTTSSAYRKKAKKFIKQLEGNLQPFETAQRLYSEGDYASAAIWFTRALETLPPERQPLIYYNLGQCNYMLKRYVPALSYYEQFLDMASLDPVTTKGYVEKAKKRRADMSAEIYVNMDTAGNVIEIDQEEARDTFVDAAQKFAEKRYTEAMDLYMKVNQAHFGGSSPDMLYNIAQCNRKLGRSATAIHFYQRSIDEGMVEFKTQAEQFITSLRKSLGWPDKKSP
ncbi:MAG: Photosystem I assembly protein Ycf3 [Chloroflexi bacterium OLB15]|nr:MAG: Photosystem I assembly protein Ycf3 [Chloroflexi bacterium OLB15]